MPHRHQNKIASTLLRAFIDLHLIQASMSMCVLLFVCVCVLTPAGIAFGQRSNGKMDGWMPAGYNCHQPLKGSGCLSPLQMCRAFPVHWCQSADLGGFGITAVFMCVGFVYPWVHWHAEEVSVVVKAVGQLLYKFVWIMLLSLQRGRRERGMCGLVLLSPLLRCSPVF